MHSFVQFGLITSSCTFLALGACGGETNTKTLRVDDALPAESMAAPAMDLSGLAQRDVEAFLNRRDRIGDPLARDAAPADPPEVEIVWHRPAMASRAPEQPLRAEPAGPVSPAAAAPEPADAAPEPPAAPPVVSDDGVGLNRDRLREVLIDLSKELYLDAAYSDMPLRELLLIAATTMVRPDRAMTPEAIPGLTERERELLGIFQRFFAELGARLDGGRSAEEVLSESVDQLRAALLTEPRLELGTVALCTRVGGFGDYDPFNKYAFLAHTEQQAIVYIEVANFTSELNAKEQWVTELSQQLTIYSDRDGIPVWREDWQSAVDVTKNRRNDFFVVQIITLPKALGVGKYHLKIRVRDEKSRAETEGAIHFEMVADPKMAATVR